MNPQIRNPNDETRRPGGRFRISDFASFGFIRPLVIQQSSRILHNVKGKLAFPLALMIVSGLSRIPGMLTQTFSAAYAVAFCSGVYFSGRMAWWIPLCTLEMTDLGLDF